MDNLIIIHIHQIINNDIIGFSNYFSVQLSALKKERLYDYILIQKWYWVLLP